MERSDSVTRGGSRARRQHQRPWQRFVRVHHKLSRAFGSLGADRDVTRAKRFICHCRSSFHATCRTLDAILPSRSPGILRKDGNIVLLLNERFTSILSPIDRIGNDSVNFSVKIYRYRERRPYMVKGNTTNRSWRPIET